jgi:hypothetical protein
LAFSSKLRSRSNNGANREKHRLKESGRKIRTEWIRLTHPEAAKASFETTNKHGIHMDGTRLAWMPEAAAFLSLIELESSHSGTAALTDTPGLSGSHERLVC